jgi:hypothetical protein
VKELTRKKPARPEPNRETERRRIGTVVHDDRGNASVSWRDAPDDFERPVLEVLGEPGLSIKSEETFDPYAHRKERTPTDKGCASAATGAGRNGARTDLRRLSEWIKMMRELEQRKREDGGEEEGP